MSHVSQVPQKSSSSANLPVEPAESQASEPPAPESTKEPTAELVPEAAAEPVSDAPAAEPAAQDIVVGDKTSPTPTMSPEQRQEKETLGVAVMV